MTRGGFGGRIILIVLVAALGWGSGSARAGDVYRYTEADRHTWPNWAVERYMDIKGAEVGGEIWEAIAFDLIQGYPVTAADYWQYQDRELKFAQPMQRAEFAAVLSRALGLAEDAPTGAWYARHLDALAARGVIPADTGGPWLQSISRREAGRWMGRAAEIFHADKIESDLAFVDVADPLVLRALQSGIVRGTGGSRYEPDRILLRGEAAVMLLRLARAMNEGNRLERDAVFSRLTEIIRRLDAISALNTAARVQTGRLIPLTDTEPAAAELATADLLRAAVHNVRRGLAAAPENFQDEWQWTQVIPAAYRFEPVELHDNIAIISVSQAAKHIYQGSGQTKFVGRVDYSELQYFTRVNGTWRLAAAK